MSSALAFAAAISSASTKTMSGSSPRLLEQIDAGEIRNLAVSNGLESPLVGALRLRRQALILTEGARDGGEVVRHGHQHECPERVAARHGCSASTGQQRRHAPQRMGEDILDGAERFG